MAKLSAGLLLYRYTEELQVLLVHPGGPFFRNKDEGAWTIPKGEVRPGEEPLAAAHREFREETGHPAAGSLVELNPVKQKGGKVVHAWAVAGDLDPAAIVCNTFELEWPPKSGRLVAFPEIDRAEWFGIDGARLKINPAQVGFLDELLQKLAR